MCIITWTFCGASEWAIFRGKRPLLCFSVLFQSIILWFFNGELWLPQPQSSGIKSLSKSLNPYCSFFILVFFLISLPKTFKLPSVIPTRQYISAPFKKLFLWEFFLSACLVKVCFGQLKLFGYGYLVISIDCVKVLLTIHPSRPSHEKRLWR